MGNQREKEKAKENDARVLWEVEVTYHDNKTATVRGPMEGDGYCRELEQGWRLIIMDNKKKTVQ